MSTTLTPNLMSDDVNRSIAFYRDRLGFRLLMGVPFDSEEPLQAPPADTPLQFAMLTRDGATLMLQARASLAGECALFADLPVAASATFYLEVASLDELLAGLGDGVETVVPERVTFYGMREQWIRDDSGYIITLAEKAAKE